MRDTQELRFRFGTTQKEISDFFGIPLTTIKNWDARKCMPSYVGDMMYALLEIREDAKKVAEIEITTQNIDLIYEQKHLEARLGSTAMRACGYDFRSMGDGNYKYVASCIQRHEGLKDG